MAETAAQQEQSSLSEFVCNIKKGIDNLEKAIVDSSEKIDDFFKLSMVLAEKWGVRELKEAGFSEETIKQLKGDA